MFVADNSNHRVVRYGPAPAYVYRARWGAFGSGRGQLQYPRGLSVDANGRTFVADPGGNRIDVFDVGGARRWARSAPPGAWPASSSGRWASAPTRAASRAVADSVNGRVQLLNPDGSVAAMFGAPAPGPTLLPDPVAVAFDGAGLVYVLDQQRSRVLVFDRAGKIIRTIGSPRQRAGQAARAVARWRSSAGGDVYVADTGNGRIVRFTDVGTHLGSFGRFRTIRGIAVSPDGSRVYGADAGTNRITVSPRTGGDLAEIGRPARRPASCARRRGIALDGAGNVWVADRGNDRVQAFSPDGAPIARFGERGVGAGPVRRADRRRGRLQRARDRRRLRQQPRPAVPVRAGERVRAAAGGAEPARPDPLQPARRRSRRR